MAGWNEHGADVPEPQSLRVGIQKMIAPAPTALRDELPFRNLERAVLHLAECKRDLEAARADLDRVLTSMLDVGLVVRLTDDVLEVAGVPKLPLMPLEPAS